MAKDANEEVKETSSKKSSKALPGLIFLIGIALILGGVLMQVGYFDMGDSPTPDQEVVNDTDNTADEEAEPVDDEGTADASDVDFSVTDIEDNVAIPVKKDISYTYAGAFAMLVNDLTVTCEEDTCGIEGDKVELKFSTADGKDYPITLTPAEPTQNLIDVPVTIQEWHENYVVIMIAK